MNSVTLIGNITAEPELRYTPKGEAVANMSVAVSRRVRQDGEWRDELDGYFRCVAFGSLGEHAAESLGKGTRVLVTGRLRQDSYEDSEGTRRTAFEIVLEDVAPALRFATAAVTKASRNGGEDAAPAACPGAGGEECSGRAPLRRPARRRVGTGAGGGSGRS